MKLNSVVAASASVLALTAAGAASAAVQDSAQPPGAAAAPNATNPTPGQTTPAVAPPPGAPPAATEEIVVVGSSNPQGQRKLAAGYAVTTVNEQALKDAAPTSAADVLKLVPGVFVETTGGVSGPNIEVRGFPTDGDAKFVTIQLDSLPIYPVSSLSFLDNSTQFRLDETLKRVEATIGGQAVLFGNGQPGATVNYVQKNGRDDRGGLAQFTYGTGDLYRFDGYYGAKLADDWYASLGGFYRTDDGVRNTQFPADQGYQVVGTITHTYEGGSFTLYGRDTYDKNAFFTPIPLIATGSGTDISIHAFPGFDPTTATFLGDANRHVTFDIAPGPGGVPISRNADLARGRGIDTHLIGFDLDKRFAGFSFTNRLSYVDGDAPTIAQFTGATPVTLGTFIGSEVTAANANPGIVAARGRATGGTATLVSSGAALTDLNQQVIGIGVWTVNKAIDAFQDEARVSHDLFLGNTATFGVYYADYDSHDVWRLGNNQVMTVQNHAQPINILLNNGVRATNGDGIYSPSFFSLDNNYHGRNVAVFLSDAWKITDRLKVDAGIRYEWEKVDAAIGNIATEDLTPDPTALYDKGASVLVGGSKPLNYDGSASSLAIDANYEIVHDFNAFVGYNRGYSLPAFDDLRSNIQNITHVDQVQGGIKALSRWYSVDLTGFYNSFEGQPASQILANGQTVNFITSSEAYGVEFDGAVKPFHNLQLAISGDYQHGEYTAGGPGITGNEVDRQPDFQFRFTPSYIVDTPVGPLNLYLTTTYVAQRYADLQNQQVLPEYATLDVGASLVLRNGVQVQFTGTNVTDTLAITEGNARVLGSGLSNGVFLGRPLFGPDYNVSVSLKF